ncbi:MULTISPECIES: UDP-2,3-diacylglucosamine diphosphatase [unclassified Polaromonas]|uniref:UDP-2,3-diacylglucosamine diphosphatase n=1 Tax=unclassified Polaromonas TaxID=2638319 RepID=UPI0018C91F39|nr:MULTISPECIES: UDP-2,3-diacylglucosamine diphosphatase [unclassified Polaromonas]MBG6070583.1 UDP-2,3-diacylglucosamine hydrolase [Polaromonas sp. CG_9.7]MBG6112581.1 UDP-2,3-diacylglucosamine hydrolase [Polaromonas sp. CG_9.2]MDH6184232.1 UDP-2,3-diacylglucosamine hydrolase [Polaromonas sp. CG_23.6]
MPSFATVPPFSELVAPSSWRTVDFISDLHLNADEPTTFMAWQAYLRDTPADAVFILGDLFEVWVGDDAVSADFQDHPESGFENRCASVLTETGRRLALFFMHGNRDFLVGPAFMAACHARLLDDPTVLSFAGQRWLLSHGDALCLDDTDYMAFRQQVRSPGWQQAFLARPLVERQAMARQMRSQSEARKRSGMDYGDVDSNAARQWLETAHARTLIHGHTHKPALHDLGKALSRVVLSDWDAGARVPRAEVLRLDSSGLQRIALPVG